ncbi:MAG TPA: hypothetical protein VFC00_36035 [Micromonosporaceae bacterium]|nr:hypothetical protein [Micromonosporaceae bacterium]
MPLRNRIKSYIVGETATIDEVRPQLWTATTNRAHPSIGTECQAAVLDQYKIYVEMADRISARRALANTFFLTLNTLVLAVIGALWRDSPDAARWILVFPLLALLVQCLAWFWLIRSYRQLNAAKYVVIGALEERLPASPYWRAEWTALGEGRDRTRHRPLTYLEQWIPLVFMFVYLSSFVVALAA